MREKNRSSFARWKVKLQQKMHISVMYSSSYLCLYIIKKNEHSEDRKKTPKGIKDEKPKTKR